MSSKHKPTDLLTITEAVNLVNEIRTQEDIGQPIAREAVRLYAMRPNTTAIKRSFGWMLPRTEVEYYARNPPAQSNAKLSDVDKEHVYLLHAQGVPVNEIAARYNCHPRTVKRALRIVNEEVVCADAEEAKRIIVENLTA